LGFSLHTYFIRKGRPEFTLPISWFILVGMLVTSLVQGAITVFLMLG
jgi:hypothetical protein